jgi:hypothetical protein
MSMVSNSKRRKTAGDSLHINDLPIGFLVDVASYLSRPSFALFAVAMSAPSTSWQNYNLVYQPSTTTKAIVSSTQWETLDFEDIEKYLATKLVDADIFAVLRSINAKDLLRKLKLTGCVNIIGGGLMPLTGSIVLEQIDLRLTKKHEDPYALQKLIVSHEIVLPILESILAAPGCVLKHITFPLKWLRFPEEWARMLDEFGERYNQQLNNRRFSCAECNENMEGEEWITTDGSSSRFQEKVCYDCLRPFCSDCGPGFVSFCTSCNKHYCRDCSTVTECRECDGSWCKDCNGGMKDCEGCALPTCAYCLNTCDCCNLAACHSCFMGGKCCVEGCSRANCDACYDGEKYNVNYCGDCCGYFCLDCQLAEYKEEGKECKCAAAIVPMLLKENDALREDVEVVAKIKDQEIIKLQKEIEELKMK